MNLTTLKGAYTVVCEDVWWESSRNTVFTVATAGDALPLPLLVLCSGVVCFETLSQCRRRHSPLTAWLFSRFVPVIKYSCDWSNLTRSCLCSNLQGTKITHTTVIDPHALIQTVGSPSLPWGASFQVARPYRTVNTHRRGLC